MTPPDPMVKVMEILQRIESNIRIILARSAILETQGDQFMAVLDDLTTQVKANTDAEQAAITLIGGLADELKKAQTDPVALQALITKLETSKEALAAAIVANTPAAP